MSGSHPLLDRLAEGPLLGDGAMGTMLYARGTPLDACFDVLNLHDRKTVQAIHAEYVSAGADCLETNTFGANRFKLGVHGLEGRVRFGPDAGKEKMIPKSKKVRFSISKAAKDAILGVK